MDRVFFVTSGSACVEPCMGLRSRVFTAHFWTLATGSSGCRQQLGMGANSMRTGIPNSG